MSRLSNPWRADWGRLIQFPKHPVRAWCVERAEGAWRGRIIGEPVAEGMSSRTACGDAESVLWTLLEGHVRCGLPIYADSDILAKVMCKPNTLRPPHRDYRRMSDIDKYNAALTGQQVTRTPDDGGFAA